MRERLLFPERGPFGSVAGPIIWPGDLRRFIEWLNPRLRVHGPVRQNRMKYVASVCYWHPEYEEEAGNEYRSEGNWRHVARIPVKVIPERSIYDAKGHILLRGWRELLARLSNRKLIKIPARYGGRHGILNFGHPVTIVNAG